MEREVDRFLSTFSAEKGFSNNTISAYRNDLTQFAAFVVRETAGSGLEPEWPLVDRSLIVSYIINLKDSGGRNYAPATVSRKVAAVKSFLGFLVKNGVLEENPSEGIAGPAVVKSVPKALSPAEVVELLRQPERHSSPESKRDKAMLELLYATGMRVTELVSLDTSDVNLREGRVRCLGRKSSERWLSIGGKVAQTVKAYLQEARPLLQGSGKDKALFLNRRGQRLTRQGFWLILKSYAEEAKIRAEITPHMLRHSIATHLLRSGKKNLKELQEFLGHASISSTQVYTQLAGQR